MRNENEVNIKYSKMAANFRMKLPADFGGAKSGRMFEILRGVLFLSCDMAVHNRE